MTDHVYKHIDVTGSSKVSSDDAIRRAISKAGESIRGMRWFKVLETRGENRKPYAPILASDANRLYDRRLTEAYALAQLPPGHFRLQSAVWLRPRASSVPRTQRNH
jgi:flavin-binding protein dodecin